MKTEVLEPEREEIEDRKSVEDEVAGIPGERICMGQDEDLRRDEHQADD